MATCQRFIISIGEPGGRMCQNEATWLCRIGTSTMYRCDEHKEGYGLPLRVAPPVAHARMTDPSTSHQAARSMSPDKMTADQQAVLELLRRRGPMCDEEILESFLGDKPISPSGARTRRAELTHMGLVRDSGDRVTLVSGRKSIVWEAADGD